MRLVRQGAKRLSHLVKYLSLTSYIERGGRKGFKKTRHTDMSFSGFKVIREVLIGHKGWKPLWRDAQPKPRYDIIIVGGGGHGLATAYYLASRHGLRNIAVLEKGWVGGGNVGRNTTIIRSNYLLDGNQPFIELRQLWEGLEQHINFNAMVSQRGVLNLYHPMRRDGHRRRHAMRCTGPMPSTDVRQVRDMYPFGF